MFVECLLNLDEDEPSHGPRVESVDSRRFSRFIGNPERGAARGTDDLLGGEPHQLDRVPAVGTEDMDGPGSRAWPIPDGGSSRYLPPSGETHDDLSVMRRFAEDPPDA